MSVDNPYYFYNDSPSSMITTRLPTDTTNPINMSHLSPSTSSTNATLDTGNNIATKKSGSSGGGGFPFFRRRSSSSSSCKSNSNKKSSKNDKQFNTIGSLSPLTNELMTNNNHYKNKNFKSFLRPSVLPSSSISTTTSSAIPVSPPFVPSYAQHGVVYAETRPSFGGSGSGSGGINSQQHFINNYHPSHMDSLNLTRSSFNGRSRLGSYNESQTYSENDDVFLSNNSGTSGGMHTMNSLTDSSNETIESGMRRHSIGIGSRDRMRCGSISDEVPKSYAPRPPSTTQQLMMNSMRQRFFDRNKSDTSCTMDDILVVTAKQGEQALHWANFLRGRFDKIAKQRGWQPFNFLHIKLDERPITSDLAKRCQSTKLQIVILCPSLVALPDHFLMSQLKILKPEIVLGILLEVTEDQIMEIHKNSLPSFKKWRRCTVRSHDQSLIGNVLGIATDILGRALCQRPVCTDTASCSNGGVNKSGAGGYSDSFTILPRKVKIGQNKVVALLNDPLQKDDWITVKIEKNGELVDVLNFKKRNPYTLQFTIPENCMEVSTMINIIINKNEKELGSRPVKCESRLRELEQILKTQDSPIEFMCHSLGIVSTDRSALDSYLQQTFQKNIPPNFHLVGAGGGSGVGGTGGAATLSSKQKCFNYRDSSEEFPTLLHFAAKWGLDHLCMQLMECPGGDVACELRNCTGKTPADLAEGAGYIKLSGSLKSFSQMNEFTTMYHYFKGISQTGTGGGNSGKNNATTTNPTLSSSLINSQSPKKVIIEQTKSTDKPIILQKPKTTSSSLKKLNVEAAATLAQQEYMEMSGSDHDSAGSRSGSVSGPSSSSSALPISLIGRRDPPMTPINAVTNLNYINIESNSKEDEKLSVPFDITDSIDGGGGNTLEDSSGGIMSNELRIQEPAYYDSNEINTKVSIEQTVQPVGVTTTSSTITTADLFSHECSMVLENCASSIKSSSSSSAVSTTGSNDTSDLSDYLIQPSNIPVDIRYMEMKRTDGTVPVATSGKDFGDYLTHPSNKPVVENSSSSVILDSDHHLKMNFKKKDSIRSNKSGTLRRQGSDTSKTSVDDELLEIMNDFKNNVFTIQEVEQLVESWTKRNDVQQSCKDKQDQLQQMRIEYDRLQEQLKQKMKRPTPFDRFKKLFSRSKSLDESNDNGNNNNGDENKLSSVGGSGHRPMSSLSLQSISSSSSSSGRMSTGSVCSGASLGDSGTHSDHEDHHRRLGGNNNNNNINNSSCRVGTPGSLMMDNYLIPPTPRPISSPITTPTSPKYFPSSSSSINGSMKSLASQSHDTIDGAGKLQSSEHYILFPSNVPVQSGQNHHNHHHQHHHHNHVSSPPPHVISSPQHDYINFSGLNTIEETKETGPEQTTTHITVQPIKVQKQDNVYGPIKQQNSSDLCSSFKPPQLQSNDNKSNVEEIESPYALTQKNIKEILKSLDDKTKESLQNLNKSIEGCTVNMNNNKINGVGVTEMDNNSPNHEYMNV